MHLTGKAGHADLRQSDGQFEVPDLAELLWGALLRMQSKEGLRPDDPVFLEFKQNVLRIIADLEVLRSREPTNETKCA